MTIDSYYRNSFQTSNAYVKCSLDLGNEFLSSKGCIIALDMPIFLMKQEFSRGSVDVLSYDYLFFKRLTLREELSTLVVGFLTSPVEF